MNKYVKIAAVATIGLVLTGCNSGKKFTCSVTNTSSFSGDSTEKIIYEFSKDGKDVVKYTEEKSYKYTDKALEYYDEDIDDIAEEAEEDCEDFEDSDIVTCEVKTSGKKVTQIVTLDLKDLDEDDLEDLYDDKDISYSVYSKAKKVIEAKYDDLKKDSQDKNNSLFKYSCK